MPDMSTGIPSAIGLKLDLATHYPWATRSPRAQVARDQNFKYEEGLLEGPVTRPDSVEDKPQPHPLRSVPSPTVVCNENLNFFSRLLQATTGGWGGSGRFGGARARLAGLAEVLVGEVEVLLPVVIGNVMLAAADVVSDGVRHGLIHSGHGISA